MADRALLAGYPGYVQALLGRRTSVGKVVTKFRSCIYGIRKEVWAPFQYPIRRQGCRSACQISKGCDNLNYQSRGFETSRDLTIRCLIGYWNGTLALEGLTHLPLDKMAAISQALFSRAFSWMKSFVFWLKFHWNLFPRVQLIITQHWFR